MPTNLHICDGTFDELLEVQSPLPGFPLLDGRQNPDRYAIAIERVYEIALASYAPTLASRRTFANYIKSSTTFASPWTATGTPSHLPANYNGIVPLDYVADPTGGATNYFTQTLPTLPAGGTWKVQFLVKRSSIPGVAHVQIYDTTAAAFRLRVDIDTRANGAPKVTSIVGTVDSVVDTGVDSIYLVVCSTTSGLVAANANVLYAQPSAASYAFPANILIGGWGMDTIEAPYIPTTNATRVVTVPECDSLANVDAHTRSPFAFQVAESKPSLVEADVLRVMKTFATVPADQVSYGKRSFNRPNLHGIKVGIYYGVSFDEGATSWLFATRKSVSSIQALSDVVTAVTGSSTTTTSAYTFPSDVVNFTIQGGGSGTFLLTDSVVTIQAALSAAGGNAFSIAAGSRTMYFNPTVLSSTGNIQSLSTGSAGVSVAPYGSGSWQIIGPTSGGSTVETVNNAETTGNLPSVRRIITTAAHSGNVGDHVVFWKGDKIVALSKAVAVPATDAVDVLLEDVPGKDFTADTCAFSSGAAFRYVNGEKDCTIKVTEKFYLPGYTAGIATGADVPQITVYADPIGWLTAISAGGAYYAISAPTLEAWMGPILVQRTEEIQMADALESRSVNA